MSDTINTMDEAIGRRIRTARLGAKHSIEHLSDLAGMSSDQWRAMEAGKARASATHLARIARVLGIEIRALFDEYCNMQHSAPIELIKQGQSRQALVELILASKESKGGTRAA